MESKQIELKKGDLLVSQPFMIDGNFRRTVIYMVEYNDQGGLGFILNRPLEYNVDELIQNFPEFKTQAFFGGPVSTNTIHYIHRLGDLIDDSVEISDGVYWGGDFEKIKALIIQGLVTDKDIKFYVGYSGWSPGQLDDELIHGSWIIAQSDSNYIFKFKNSDLWKKVLEHKGDNYKVIAQMPETFFLN